VSISAVELDSRVVAVFVEGERLEVTLRDGCKISEPLSWFPRLADLLRADRQAA
jgi:hypothetical protein